jgi:Phage Mu protein F like protein
MDRQWTSRHDAMLRIGAEFSNAIRIGIKDSVDIDALLAAWHSLDLSPVKDDVVNNESARQWASVNAYIDNKKLNEALFDLYADGWALGTDIANQALMFAKTNKAVSSPAQIQTLRNMNWDAWKAGNKPAAALLNPPHGLTKLMNSRNIKLQDIGKTTTNRIGTILGNALSKGLPASAVKADIAALVGDSERALLIAQTEMSRAVNTAARQTYQDTGVEFVEWLDSDGCPECEENASVSPLPIDSDFPSGDTEPPAHPNCICSLAPYMVTTQGDVGYQGE